MKLSIIIPVYNVETYIKRCLESCVHQDISKNDYEIIIVNDGTKDNSIGVIEPIVNEYNNIKIISQENQGLSLARNNGLKHAQGEYIWFIDSDDWIEENCLSEICRNLREIDLLQIQYRFTYDNTNLNSDQPFCEINNIISGKQQIESGGVLIPAPFSIYRKQYLLENKLSFFPNIYHEDLEFKPRALYFAKSCKSLNRVIYNYYQRSNGNITGHFTKKHGLDLILIMDHMINFAQSHDLTLCQRRYYYSIIGIAMNSFLFGLQRLDKISKKILIDELSNHKSFFYKMFESGKIKYMIESSFFILNIRIGLFFHSVFR